MERSAGVGGAHLDWSDAREHRDYMARHLDDAGQVSGYADQGAVVVKGEARISGLGVVQVGERELRADHLIVATGAVANIPPIDGLDQITTWTNRQTYTTKELPGRAVLVGGGAVGVETGLFLARFGAEVTVVQRSDRLLDREEPRVSELVAAHLAGAGVDFRTGTSPRRARRDGSDSILELDDGTEVRGDVLIFATGRSPRTDDLGLDRAGVSLGDRGEIVVDDQCRASDGVWAIGDVTGILPFTHVAKYQGCIVTDTIVGTPRRAHYDGIPRVVFADPEIAAAGLTQHQADQQGLSTATAEIDLTDAIARPWTYERNPRGHLGLIADTERAVLVGAWAVAPLAGEWIHQASLAIRARIPLTVLLDQVAQFPTYSEGYLAALEALDLRQGGGTATRTPTTDA